MELDPHGQPYGTPGASRREIRDLCEMMGIVSGWVTVSWLALVFYALDPAGTKVEVSWHKD